MLNVVDGCMPSDLGAGTSAEIEEERRLLYVAMTRAKDDLHLVVPQRFFTHGQHAQGDRHVYASRTRFIPEKLLGSVREDRLAARGGRRRGARRKPGPAHRRRRPHARNVAVGGSRMCNLYSITTNVEAIRRLFQIDASNDTTGNLPPMPGIFPDYPAPIVRNGAGGRELAMARWGMPSSQKALMDATKKRADKLEPRASRSTSSNCCGWSRTAARRTSATLQASTLDAVARPRQPLRCAVHVIFSEYDTIDRKEGATSGLRPTKPAAACFAGLWTNWTSVRKAKEGEVKRAI